MTLAGEALALQERQPADLLILDVGLPDISGFEACKRLRRFSEVPVIFLTARDAEIDRVVGLEIGADDYVVKPFSPREVAARVKAILKRMAPRPAALEEAAPSGPFQVDEERVRIHYRDTPLNLTRHEFRLLQTLLGQPSGYSAASSCSTPSASPARPATSATSTATSEPARQAAPGERTRRSDPDPSRPGLQLQPGPRLMPLGVRIFLVYFLFVGLTGYFVLSTVMDEVRPGVRQSTEETLVDTANLLAGSSART